MKRPHNSGVRPADAGGPVTAAPARGESCTHPASQSGRPPVKPTRPGRVRSRIRPWERNGSGDSLASAVRRGHTQRSCPARIPPTCRNDVGHRAAALSSEAERFGGPAGPVTPPDFRVAGAERVHRGPLTASHEAPSPADAGDNNPASPVTGSGHATHEHGVSAYNANVQQACADHVTSTQACETRHAPAQWSPPRDGIRLHAPRPVSPGHLSGQAPGE
jgi:hypothetical protein